MQTTNRQRRHTPRLGRRMLVGRRIASHRLEHTLLPKVLALPVFSSDALSSVAYATEEILLVLLSATAAAEAARRVMPIAMAIAALLVVVVISYRQTVRAYSAGGGAYVVSKENLGTLPSLVAAGALLTDYVLTVSVSISAGVFAVTSVAPSLLPVRVQLALGFVAFITLVNLRGVRESGTLFAVPTYAFILAVFTMIILGFARCVGGCPQAEAVPSLPGLAEAGASLGFFTILRAFASGSTALTGVEAVSDGVPAFRRPQARNAAATLAMMGVIAGAMFLGISFLATNTGVTVSEERSVVAQIAHTVFGGGIGFYAVQVLTAAILVLAANTAYQDFPRLSAILARDGFIPRRFQNRGDRLVFSNGILLLATAAGALIVAFGAEVSRLIQLYVVGVFTSFTLSQTGMVRHWFKAQKAGTAPTGWRRSVAINTVGAVVTGVVLVVVTVTKFMKGAWIVIVAVPFMIAGFYWIKAHYLSVSQQLRRGRVRPGEVGANRMVLLVPDLGAATAEALGYIRSARPAEVHFVHPIGEGADQAETTDQWQAFSEGAGKLELMPVTGDDLLGAVRGYIRRLPRTDGDVVTVVIPEAVESRLAVYLWRKRAVVRLKAGLLREHDVVVADVPVRMNGNGNAPSVDRGLIPHRTVALVFVSGVHDASIRALNYARTLGATETRAVYFDLDPDAARRMEQEWPLALGVPLDIVEAPFRDLTGPIQAEVRRVTARPGTLCAVIIPEVVVSNRLHVPLHGQNALFVKRLLLYEPRVVLSSVPYQLEAS